MLCSRLLLIISLLLYSRSFLCWRNLKQNLLDNSNLEQNKTNDDSTSYIDYTILSNLDIKSLESTDLKTEGCILLEGESKIVLKDQFTPEKLSNQILCASAKYSNDLNKTGYSNKIYHFF